MNLFTYSILSGVLLAIVTFVLMLPMKWKTKREKVEAISAAAIERLVIAFVATNLQIVGYPPVNGLVVGIVMSLPSAIITRAYVPVILVGGIGATIIGTVRMLLGL